MRTFTLVSAFLLSSSYTAAVAGPMASFDSPFDTSILNARAALPATIPMVGSSSIEAFNASNMKRGMVKMVKRVPLMEKRDVVEKRGNDDEEECEADEDDSTDSDDGDDDAEECDEEDGGDDDDDEDCDDEPESPSQPETVTPVAETPAPPKTEEKPSTPAKEPTKKPQSNVKVPEVSSPDPAVPAKGAIATATPSNIASESFKVSDGCIRYHTVLAGEVCLGVLDGSRDLGLTLDQLYCLNPGLNEDCSNLYEGQAYCTGFGGEWPKDS